jgi:hypothetical protein
MSLKPAVRFVIAFGILFGILYALLTPETFTTMKAQTVVVNGPNPPMTDTQIERALGVSPYLPPVEEEEEYQNKV